MVYCEARPWVSVERTSADTHPSRRPFPVTGRDLGLQQESSYPRMLEDGDTAQTQQHTLPYPKKTVEGPQARVFPKG